LRVGGGLERENAADILVLADAAHIGNMPKAAEASSATSRAVSAVRWDPSGLLAAICVPEINTTSH
jgi:hypothetical protein